MPIYIESRDLAGDFGFVAEHQYLVYVPDGQELNYDAWPSIRDVIQQTAKKPSVARPWPPRHP